MCKKLLAVSYSENLELDVLVEEMTNIEKMMVLRTTLDINFVPDPKILTTKEINTPGTPSKLKGG